jgi:hypothetical protein
VADGCPDLRTVIVAGGVSTKRTRRGNCAIPGYRFKVAELAGETPGEIFIGRAIPKPCFIKVREWQGKKVSGTDSDMLAEG